MTSELDPRRKPFLVKGFVPELPRVPVIDPNQIWQEATAQAMERTQTQENERVLMGKIGHLLEEVGPGVKAMASKRYEQGEYETISRLSGERYTFWDEDTDGSRRFFINFRARRKTVREVSSFKMHGGHASVEIKFREGKVAEAVYDFDHDRLQERVEKGSATDWEKWLYEKVIQASPPENLRTYQILSDFIFVVSPPGIRFEKSFWPRGGFRHKDTQQENRGERNYHKSTREWVFNAERNRFAVTYEAHRKTREEYLGELLRAADGDEVLENIAIENTSKRKSHNYPVLSPQEFTQGLELLLDTIPLEK